MKKAHKPMLNGLPYVDTWQGVMITLAINLLVTAVLYWCGVIGQKAFASDAFNCGFITSISTVALVYPKIKRLRQAGELPRVIEEGQSLQKLPRSPVPLALVLGVLFAVLMTLFALAVQRFFGIEEVTPLRFLVWKLVYATLLSVKLTELVVLRLVQPDCARPGEPEQNGAAIVKNPLPRKETIANLFRTVTGDFGSNLLFGLLFGNVVIRGHDVIIRATTRSSIVIGGLILGAIITLQMIYPVAKSIRAQRDAGALPLAEKRTPAAWLPNRPSLFALALLLPTMLTSAAVLWGTLTFFGFEELNFFQYFVVRTIYVTLLSKLVLRLTILRYTQSDKRRADEAAA